MKIKGHSLSVTEASATETFSEKYLFLSKNEKKYICGRKNQGTKATSSSRQTAASRPGYTSERKEERYGETGRGSWRSAEKPAESAEIVSSSGKREKRTASPKSLEAKGQRTALYLRHLQFSFHGLRCNFT